MKKILLIGDSISLDYGRILPKLVSQSVIYSKDGTAEAYENLDIPVGGNGGDSAMVLDYITQLEDDISYDYFIFNCGLHDIKRFPPFKDTYISAESYCENLKKIVTLMQSRGAQVLFINTTATNEKAYTEDFPFVRYNSDVDEFNRIAEAVMDEFNVPVIDLHGFTTSLERKDMFRDHTHFTDYVIHMQAAYMAGRIDSL